MNNRRSPIRISPLLFTLLLFSFGCSGDLPQKKNPGSTPKPTPSAAAPVPVDRESSTGENRVAASADASETGIGLVREKGDFWLGYPNKQGSMKYLRLAENTEIKVLGMVEGYYEVAHRGLVGYVEKQIVDLMEPDKPERPAAANQTDLVASPAPQDAAAPARLARNEAKASTGALTVTPCTGGGVSELLPGVSCSQYRSKVLEKVSTLESYIKRIIDKSEINRQKSIDLACRLFVNEQARVYTSGLNEGGRSRPVRKYLNSLMALSYDRVEINWTNIQYVSDLRKGPDGRYFGYVQIEQQFKGFIDGQLVYGDVTEKKITVVLEAYEIVDAAGDAGTRWDVFLSDIGVEQVKSIN